MLHVAFNVRGVNGGVIVNVDGIRDNDAGIGVLEALYRSIRISRSISRVISDAIALVSLRANSFGHGPFNNL